MGYSVYGILAMNMFGIPHVGADICGFNGDTNPELCAKWHMVGATYSFSRNHNSYGQMSQEPYVFKNDMYNVTYSLMDSMKFAIQTKYSLLKYYHSQMTHVNNNGGPLLRPLFFDFPEDLDSYRDINYNYMIGDSLKVSFATNTTTVYYADQYFPAGSNWCELMGRTVCIPGSQYLSQSQELLENRMYVRDGKVVPHHMMAYQDTMQSYHDLEQLPIDFVINPRITDMTKKTWTATNDIAYQVDDGNFDITKIKANKYTVLAKDDGSGGVTITFTASAGVGPSAVNTCVGSFNQNDLMQQIVILNPAGIGLNPKEKYTTTYVDGASTNTA